jgi:ribosomal protein S18 acetylase RimI-like enzyme
VIKGNELKNLAVRPDLQAKGFGRKFASFLINEIIRRGNKTVVLNVVNGNYAKKLYESLGFKEKTLFDHVLKFYRPDSRLHMLPDEYILALQGNNFSLYQ